MNLGLIFFLFLPLILFTVFTQWKGLQAGVIAACVGVLLLFAFDFYTTGKVDKLTVIEGGLMLFLGAVSIVMKNEKYFKFQPTVTGFLIVGVLVFYQMRGTPFFVEYISHMDRMFTPENASAFSKQAFENLHSDYFRIVAAKLSLVLPWVVGIHAIWMAYAAVRLKTTQWLAWRFAIYPMIIATVLVIGMANPPA